MNEGHGKKVKLEEIVDTYLGDKTRPAVVKLSGLHLGNSEREGHYRLYDTNDLTHYFEFPKQAVVDAERFDNGRICVWLARGAAATEVKTRAVSEDFLAGDIQQGYGRRARGMRRLRAMAGAAPQTCGYSDVIPANCPDTRTAFTCQVHDPSPDCPYN